MSTRAARTTAQREGAGPTPAEHTAEPPAEPRNTGLRERKKQATRTALGLAALRLAAERGWAAVRVEDIAAEAGVSARTFNNYFSSKEEAVMASGTERAERVRAALAARPPEEPLWDALTHAFATALEHSAVDPSTLLRARLALTHAQLAAEQVRFEAGMAATLAAEIARRTGTDPERDLYPLLAATVALTTTRLTFEHWVRTGSRTPVAEAVRRELRRVRVDP
ncbi:TetR family transcriptional regulator [Streptomyces mobaraensis NBRC 13819 = DSM 40847]|uniref:TetR family transcriptional regulator n=2 Tax=Streptomyces mobaraensis TaxID=35621 RepID=A0A5N5W0M4_STRMB|nr:TetR family transcriptional regulator [Streptomyces mobaraensis]EME97721.1 TetR family transcriptional regulator [Streptomyces mobaraensis NBRC 13819 = DSM 40847]KAB7835168.1 TetR family transcriptional regulator [Streptomyces mobaraensis]QTT74133.1 TetR family transcriptional regulator [Streptomyces mobaraensis NBRC 13819 = DSM 40847]